MNIPSRTWTKQWLPKRILAIRLQAMGDLVITLPYLQDLRERLGPKVELDLLTRQEVDAIPKDIILFDNIYAIGGGRDLKKQLFYSFLLLPKLILRRYDGVLDLQNNLISRLFRKAIRPAAWSEFDRFSPIAAGDRTRLTIDAMGIGKSKLNTHFRLRSEGVELHLLHQAGWDPSKNLILLNPAGAFPSRNWPLDHYVQFATLWRNQFPKSQFLVLGTELIAAKVMEMEKRLPGGLINLVNKTSVIQAFAIIQQVDFVLSEDSGLMHMAWVSGIPTLVLFGSTRSDWAQPLGCSSFFLDSSDLPCGNCMQQLCQFGDTHCLSRYSAEMIFQMAVGLMEKSGRPLTV